MRESPPGLPLRAAIVCFASALSLCVGCGSGQSPEPQDGGSGGAASGGATTGSGGATGGAVGSTGDTGGSSSGGAPTNPDVSPIVWVDCAKEKEFCAFEGSSLVRYGSGDTWVEQQVDGQIDCTNDVFGDPTPGVVKICQVPEGVILAEPTCTYPLKDGRRVHGDASPLVKFDPTCGKLAYGLYANEGDNRKVNLVPDFSFAGYMKGGVALPELPVVESISPISGDNHARLQAAIKRVEARAPDSKGFRGALLLKKGRWNVSDSIVIAKGGVVLRGEGQGKNGTVLVATKKEQHDFLILQGEGKNPQKGVEEVKGTAVEITTQFAPTGAMSFEVSDASGYSVGDVVGIRRLSNEAWIEELKQGQWWKAEGIRPVHERTILAIDGKRITIDIPLVDPLYKKYGGGELFLAEISGRIEQCGVENLRIDSSFTSEEDEEHGWNAIVFDSAANSWVNRVTVTHFGHSGVRFLANSSFNTAEEVAVIEPISIVRGGTRYAFNIDGGTGNFFNRCYAEHGRHNFVTGSRVSGPHVWLDSLSTNNNSDEGPHHRWATGLLFDNLHSHDFHVQNRMERGEGHGWAGAQVMLWNLKAVTSMIIDAPLGAMNWSVGSEGLIRDSHVSPDEVEGIIELPGASEVPRSLYLAQLQDRLGEEAVQAVTISEQRHGRIWSLLNGWEGEGLLTEASPVDP